MAHRFSNTQAQRESISPRCKRFFQRVVLNMTTEEIDRIQAVASLDCYAELAHEVSLAIVKVLREEGY